MLTWIPNPLWKALMALTIGKGAKAKAKPKAKSKATSKATSKPKSKPKKRKAKSLVESTPGTREDGEPHDNSNGKPSTQKQTRREKDEIEKKLHSVSCLYFFCNLELGQNQLLTHRQPCRYGF